jgi:multidrug efflux pump subunit AcrA (membrane-fusion protein)
MEAEIDLINRDGQLMPGMYADVILTLEKRENAITVPVQALLSRGDKRIVMIVNSEGLVEEREVQVGIETSTRIEVRSGLSQNELVVIGNRTELKTGQKVEPKISGV